MSKYIKPALIYLFLSLSIAYAMYQMHFRVESEFTDFFLDIMNGEGWAPDQYRVLPYLILKSLLYLCTHVVPFSTISTLISDSPILRTIFVFNVLFSIVMLWLLDLILSNIPERKRYTILLLFAILYPMAHFSGPRPITQLVVIWMALQVMLLRSKASVPTKTIVLWLLIGLLSFTRSDVALCSAIYLALCLRGLWLNKIGWMVIPLATQVWLQFSVFPEATYYVPVISLGYNLTPHFLKYGNHYILLTAVILYFDWVKDYVGYLWNTHKSFVFCILGYLVVVMVIARLYEYRLYLPFVPFFFAFYVERFEWKSTKKANS